MAPPAPILVAYDGSPSARHAVRRAAALFPGRRALVVTVWEPGMAYGADPVGPSIDGIEPVPVSPEAVRAVDEAEEGQAERVAAEGAELAAAHGLEAQPLAVPDDQLKVTESLAHVAAHHGAAAVVIGSHGHRGWRARVLGSTSQSMLHHARTPVVVVPPEDAPG